jgi:hypothetical protein
MNHYCPSGAASPAVAASRGMMDTLAKHYPDAAGAGAGGTAAEALLVGQLEEKLHRHQLFLQFLTECHGMALLDARSRQLVVEHGEQVAALLALRRLSNQIHSDGGGGCLPHRLPHCVSLTVSLTVSPSPCLSLCLSLCLSHCVSLTVSPTVSPSPPLPLCLSHCLAHCVSLAASPTVSPSLSRPLCLSH